MKKILVSLLCAVMVVTFMPSMAFAADLQMPSDAENNQPQAGIENEQPQAEEGGGEQEEAAGTEENAGSGQLQGDGTTESPYFVDSADDLKFIGKR